MALSPLAAEVPGYGGLARTPAFQPYGGLFDRPQMFASSRMRWPFENWGSQASWKYQATRIAFRSPPYWSFGLRVAMPGFKMHYLSGEYETGIDYITEGVSIEVSGVRLPVSFSGAPGCTTLSGQVSWSDPLPYWIAPNTLCYAITAASLTNVGSTYEWIGGYTIDQSIGEGMMLSATSLAGKLVTGDVVGPRSSNVRLGYGPCMAVAQGWDGRPVALLPGDSIMALPYSYITQGLNDPKGGIVPYSNFGFSGNRQSFETPMATNFGFSGNRQSFETPMATKWPRRKAALDQLPNLPFTFILHNLGVNEMRGGSVDWAAMQPLAQQYHDELAATFGVPVHAAVVGPNPAFVNNGLGGDLVNQVPAPQSAYPTVVLQRLGQDEARAAGGLRRSASLLGRSDLAR
jgi:hypothetical protein